MDEDPVLRELADDLDREDPRLAARLRAGPRRDHGTLLGLLGLVALAGAGVAVRLGGLEALGALCLAVVLGSPVVACWWWAKAAPLRPADGRRADGRGPGERPPGRP